MKHIEIVRRHCPECKFDTLQMVYIQHATQFSILAYYFCLTPDCTYTLAKRYTRKDLDK